jgi:hypothetical protein
VLDPSFLNAVNTNILPALDNAYDLGSSNYRWRSAYLSGTLTVPTANVSSLQVDGMTADPSLAAGKIWFRSDLKQIRWSPDGSTVKQVYPADWGDITNKPATYPPSPHTHSRGDITDFWSSPFWGNIPDKPSTFPPSAHASSHAYGGSDAIGDDALRFRQIGIERDLSYDVSIPPLGEYRIPSGVYYVRTNPYTVIQFYDDIAREWVDIVSYSSCGLVISDGVSVRAWNFDTVYTGVIKLFPLI